MRRLVYISGPISDPDCIRVAENLRRFAEAENMLLREGFAPINPAADWEAVSLGGTDYEMLMERDLSLLRAVGVMDGGNWQLDGWQQSTGAVREYHASRDYGVECVEECEGVGRLHDVLRDDFVGALSWSPDD